MDYPNLAFELYRLTRDPLLLDAIRVLLDPEDPSYEVAKTMVERLQDARELLTPQK